MSFISPQLITADDDQRAPKANAPRAEFFRVLRLVWPYRWMLVLGILCSILFAGLQTASLSAVFPVFKILLEDEGLAGWSHRMIAADRLGVELEQPVATEGKQPPTATSIRVVRASKDAVSDQLKHDTRFRAAGGQSVDVLLEQIARAPEGAQVPVIIEAEGKKVEATLQPRAPSSETRMLRWVLGLVPATLLDQKMRMLVTILVVMVLASLVGNLCRYLGEVMVSRGVLCSLLDLRETLYDRTLQLPMTFFAGQPTSDVVTRFVQDMQEIQRGLLTLFGKAIREPIRAVFILALALSMDWQITVTMTLVAPLVVLIFWGIGRRVKKANRKLLIAYGVMIDALSTSLQNLRVVKAYTAEEIEARRLEKVDETMFRQQVKLAKLDAAISPGIEALAVVAGSIVAVWLAGRVLNNELEPSKFMALGVVLSMLFDPLRKLTDVYVRIQRSTAGAERIFQVIDAIPESAREGAGRTLPPIQRGIEYKNVGFTYPNAPTPALQEINLTIARGETVAIVGPNGCGKTTLVSMLPRFFDPQHGQVAIDGVDIRDASLRSLRGQIGLVSQEAVIFAGTPIENIAYGAETPDVARAEDAARRAFADEFIRKLDGGFESQIGERGTTLSGGQRQRLAIARAIYRDAPILIFDEATSQIDTESELKIQTALREFSKGRTTIIIAHRLSTIQFASRIVVMEAGRIVDSGPHRELLARCPLYRTLCETQIIQE